MMGAFTPMHGRLPETSTSQVSTTRGSLRLRVSDCDHIARVDCPSEVFGGRLRNAILRAVSEGQEST
jgi:hypothetical protein